MAFGQTEILVIVLVVLLLFGATAIPKLARSLGRAQGEFKRAKSEFDTERAKGETEAATGPSEEQIRRTAKELGIADEGKSLDEVKRLINEKLG